MSGGLAHHLQLWRPSCLHVHRHLWTSQQTAVKGTVCRAHLQHSSNLGIGRTSGLFHARNREDGSTEQVSFSNCTLCTRETVVQQGRMLFFMTACGNLFFLKGAPHS